jgi:hypothetical protein
VPVAQDASLLDGRIGHDGNGSRPAPRQKIGLDASPREIVQNLVGGNGITAGKRSQLLHVADIEIAHAPGLD